MSYEYATHPTKLRIFSEPTTGGHQWSVDGIDSQRRYTEACWSFDTFAEAVAALAEFHATYLVKAGTP